MYEFPLVNGRKLVIFGHEAAVLYRERIRAHLPKTRAEEIRTIELHRGDRDGALCEIQNILHHEGFADLELGKTIACNGRVAGWRLTHNNLGGARTPYASPKVHFLLKRAYMWCGDKPQKRWVWIHRNLLDELLPHLDEDAKKNLLPEGVGVLSQRN